MSFCTLLTEFITKKMSGGEKNQAVGKRSAEGQCTKQPKGGTSLFLICGLEGAGERYSIGVGWGSVIEELAVQSKRKPV